MYFCLNIYFVKLTAILFMVYFPQNVQNHIMSSQILFINFSIQQDCHLCNNPRVVFFTLPRVSATFDISLVVYLLLLWFFGLDLNIQNPSVKVFNFQIFFRNMVFLGVWGCD